MLKTVSVATTSLLVVSFVVLLRSLVGLQPHSGEGNHHGSPIAYGGDYEAQRHWMELTLHLPIGQWYWYDLQYWGLDYPPLTAYVSYICGAVSVWLMGPEGMELEASRGYEDRKHKAFMRATVLFLDLLIYFPPVYFLLKQQQKVKKHSAELFWATLLALAQPAMILVDHGHFQYNTVALGFALWSVCYFAESKMTKNCVLGSIFFCLALNFKQMTLYYAPVIFAYLLGWCCQTCRSFIPRFLALGATVIAVFSALWFPFLINGPPETDELERAMHVLRRIFPLERGLFEGKVSNLWCALSTKPFNIRTRIPEDVQPLVALAVTVLMVLPACVKLFQIGRKNNNVQLASRALTWGTTNSALAFFLASFQVHEKSLLLALAPASLLMVDDPVFFDYFSILATWTMWPLFVIDRLHVAYVCVMIIFWNLLQMRPSSLDGPATTTGRAWFWWASRFSFLVMIVLHILEIIVEVPPDLPDLFAVLWSIVGCGMCGLAWLRSCWQLFQIAPQTKKFHKRKLE